MAKEINSIVLGGRLANSPKATKWSSDGHVSMAVTDVAVDKYDRNGKKYGEFYHVLAFGRVADRLVKIEKGTAIFMKGTVSIRENQGTTRSGVKTTFRNLSVNIDDFTLTAYSPNTVDVSITGRISKDLKTFVDSKTGDVTGAVTNLASDYWDYSAKENESQFFPLLAFGDVAQRLEKAVKKGYRVYIKGRLVSRTHRDEERGVSYKNDSIQVDNFKVLDHGKETKRSNTAPAATAPAAAAPAPAAEEPAPETMPF